MPFLFVQMSGYVVVCAPIFVFGFKWVVSVEEALVKGRVFGERGGRGGW